MNFNICQYTTISIFHFSLGCCFFIFFFFLEFVVTSFSVLFFSCFHFEFYFRLGCHITNVPTISTINETSTRQYELLLTKTSNLKYSLFFYFLVSQCGRYQTFSFFSPLHHKIFMQEQSLVGASVQLSPFNHPFENYREDFCNKIIKKRNFFFVYLYT